MSGHNPLLIESGAEVLKALRAPEYVIPTLVLPVAFYSLFGVVLSMGGGNSRRENVSPPSTPRNVTRKGSMIFASRCGSAARQASSAGTSSLARRNAA